MNEQKCYEIHIYESSMISDDEDLFEFKLKLPIADKQEFNNVSMDFYFKLVLGVHEPDSLIFANKSHIFEFNFKNDTIMPLYKFTTALLRQPQFLKLNET